MDKFKLSRQSQGQKIYWYYNINKEQEWNDSKVFPSVTDTQQLELIKQQEQQLLFIADPTDTVIFHHKPDQGFLDYLSASGCRLPQFLYCKEEEPFIEVDIDNSMLVPYLHTEELERRLVSEAGVKVFGSDPRLVKTLNNKFHTRRLVESNGFQTTEGVFCNKSEELLEAYTYLKNRGFEKCVLKIPYGSSGKGLKLIENEDAFQMLSKFISRRNPSFELLLEGWHPVQANLNAQLWIHQDEVEILAVTSQRIDVYGVYLGTNYTPEYNQSLLELYTDEMLRLGSLLQGMGYSGVAGVDSILSDEGVLYPVIEINARFTQVTYLLPLINQLKPDYPFIESRYYRCVSKNDLDFQTIRNELDEVLKPTQDNAYRIYTYAKKSTGTQTHYRIYILFFGNDALKISEMIQAPNFLFASLGRK